jgi:hypothetical protein
MNGLAELAASEKTNAEVLDELSTYFGRLEIYTSLRHALTSCVALAPGQLEIQVSVSEDKETHGEKYYRLLYSSPNELYEELQKLDDGRVVPRLKYQNGADLQPAAGTDLEYIAPIGQLIVKQTFEVSPVNEMTSLVTNTTMPFEHLAQTQFARELFIMLKRPPGTPGSDNGWVYGVLTPDGKEVIRAGALNDCMKCHTQTGRDRLFGPEVTWPLVDDLHVPPYTPPAEEETEIELEDE